MYEELDEFLLHMARQRAIWRDGELWTSLVLGSLAGSWFYLYPEAVVDFRGRLGELLTVASIIFGFVLTTLVFYIQAADAWSRDKRVGRVADKLVDWHVWTIFCLLGLIGSIVLVWICEDFLVATSLRAAVSHGLLVFLAIYCCLQILNHVLTVRWVFRNRCKLKDGPGGQEAMDDGKPKS